MSMRSEPRGQAAMEFLMTYGWAILVVLVAIAALAYFGVLNPQRFLPETCTVGPGISCDDFKVGTGGDATIVLRNGMGVELDTVTLSIGAVAGTCTPNTNWGAGNQMSCAWAAGALATGSAGSRFSADIVLGYTQQGSAVSHQKTGTLTTKYE